MDVVKRNKPTKAMKRAAKKASKKDYAKMVIAASEVVMRNRGNQYRTGAPEYVLISFPYWAKFAEGFPKGPLVEKAGRLNTHKVNAVKLLDWLFDNGHSTYNTKMLVQQTRAYEVMDNSIDKMLDI